MVDLRLASTYIPALTCLIRTSIVLVLISREPVVHSTPALIGLGLVLYLDRIVREEVIFDSSALTYTIFVAHVLNLSRSSYPPPPAPPSPFHGLVQGGNNAQSRHFLERQQAILFETRAGFAAAEPNATALEEMPPPPDFFVKHTSRSGAADHAAGAGAGAAGKKKNAMLFPWRGSGGGASASAFPSWYADLVYLIYIAVSVMQIVDVDPVGMLCPSHRCNRMYLGALRGGGGGDDHFPESCHVSPSDRETNPSSATYYYDHRQSAGFRRWYDYHRILRAPPGSSTSSTSMGGTGNSNVVRVSTVVTHCILAGLAVQVRVADAEAFMAPARILARGFVFYALCVAWTYAVGIRDACISVRAYPYYVNPMAQPAMPSWRRPTSLSAKQQQQSSPSSSCDGSDEEVAVEEDECRDDRAMACQQHLLPPPYVQPFTPCQLRFAVLLFADRWHFVAAALASGVVVGERVHRAAFSSSSSSCAPSPAAAAATATILSPSEEHEDNVQRLRSSSSAAHKKKRRSVVAVAAPSSLQISSSGGQDTDDAHLFQLAFAAGASKPPSLTSYMVPSQLMSGIAAPATRPPSRHHGAGGGGRQEEEEEEEKKDDPEEDQLARMFRLARQQQQRQQLGELL